MTAQPLWIPSHERCARARMTDFTERLRQRYGQRFPDYWSLWRWSLANKEVFWREVWDYCGIVGDPGQRVLEDGHLMPGARWFPEARLNYAENLLAHAAARADQPAIVFANERGEREVLTWRTLTARVSRRAQELRALGVGPGDVVASLLPNMPEAVVAMLATTSLGAAWTSTSPDFGIDGVLDRFGQLTPKVLFAVDGYPYNGTNHDVRAKVEAVAARLPSLVRVIEVPYRERHQVPRAPEETANAALEFWRGPFAQPLYVVYSSGTTGLPKAMIHGAGGALLQIAKEHALHCDLHAGDRLFFFTTTGWMMWNWLVTALAQGVTIVLYDGSPLSGGGTVLWQLAEREQLTHMGVSAKYLDAIAKAGLVPRQRYDLSTLRVLMSTGSPLAPERFDYVYENVKSDLHLASMSGGTDLLSCFALGNPTLPVWRGELQCRGLGMAVDVWDETGKPVPPESGLFGELVCTQVFPSMPVGFVNDPEGKRYRAAYFERYPGVWHHGDWCRLTEHDGMVIVGRSDATLNPGGVRIGTAEIYRQVEKVPEVEESVAIGQAWDNDTRIVLFVKLKAGHVLDEALCERIKKTIREGATPRHVPAKILQVPDIPRTRSNKIVELAVRDIVHGREPKNVEALANPEALEYFRARPELAQ
ncbi:MAG: acetoacetate--CoA ligase [Burkholderiales bacterium]|nr:acetoacetate--CoA ligase [Burkholderiales bacterium]